MIEVGSIVEPKDERKQLRSGAEWYPCAIVLSVDPYVMVSEGTDMRWSCEDAVNYKVIGKASMEVMVKCMRRLKD